MDSCDAAAGTAELYYAETEEEEEANLRELVKDGQIAFSECGLPQPLASALVSAVCPCAYLAPAALVPPRPPLTAMPLIPSRPCPRPAEEPRPVGHACRLQKGEIELGSAYFGRQPGDAELEDPSEDEAGGGAAAGLPSSSSEEDAGARDGGSDSGAWGACACPRVLLLAAAGCLPGRR